MDTMSTFESYRPLLFAIAYRMLGSVMEAEDIVQEAYVRYQGANHDNIQNQKAFLTTIVTRLSLNQLNSARVQRETHLGPWLPEPMMTSQSSGKAELSSRFSRYDDISMAFMVILETLSPAERAVFLLREVFNYEYSEIATIITKSEPACRQLFSRAKKHVSSNRPRFKSTPEEHKRLLNTFIHAVEDGKLDTLMDVLAEDVTLIPDGVGRRGAAIRILYGRDAIIRFISGIQRFVPADVSISIDNINGLPAVITRDSYKRVYGVVTIAITNGKVSEIHANYNQSKLAHLNSEGT